MKKTNLNALQRYINKNVYIKSKQNIKDKHNILKVDISLKKGTKDIVREIMEV